MSNPTADFVKERKPAPAPAKGILKKRPVSSKPEEPEPEPSSTTTISFNAPTGEPQDQEPITGLTPSQASRILQLAKTELIKPAIPLATFEFLCTLPLSPSTSASSPTAADTALFLSHISAFTPAEYLDLIEERNCLNKCGYTLCPKPKRNMRGEFKIHQNGVAKTADLNKWCSDECALRALYIKVQLDNPSYVRKNGEMVVKIELREEKKSRTIAATPKPTTTTSTPAKEDEEKLSKDLAKLDLNTDTPPKRNQTEEEVLEEKLSGLELTEQKKVRQMVGALAIERNRQSSSKVEVNIKEKETTQTPQAPSVSKPKDAHLMVEGYNSASKGKKPEQDEDESDDDDDDDDPFPTVRLEVINMGKS
ncbi:Rtr1/RPAP2 family-domain-containing protein [Cladorrhinum sp. PSN259]|nr:Rtr1/RPAP2 family-domain-containing protein [Cladorrhinum sp. PSN259]